MTHNEGNTANNKIELTYLTPTIKACDMKSGAFAKIIGAGRTSGHIIYRSYDNTFVSLSDPTAIWLDRPTLSLEVEILPPGTVVEITVG